MIKQESKQYVNMLQSFFSGGTNNHEVHNDNPLYWDLLLKDIKENPLNFDGKVGLDFGCGKGRNVTNMLSLANFKRVDGIDISSGNISYCLETYTNQPSEFYKNSGADLSDLKNNEYDFVMSTIVLQHICVHDVRMAIKKEIYRVLKDGGIFSFQMGYGNIDFLGTTQPKAYLSNPVETQGSNGVSDVRVTNENELIEDLKSIGFKNITFEIHEPFSDCGHPNWIYVRCEK